MMVYADTSALVKLIVPEAESEALRNWRDETGLQVITAELTRTELMRAVRRSAPEQTSGVHELLRGVGIVNLDHSVYDEAGFIPPLELRSLDAIHLIAARLAGKQLDGMLTYDDRLAEAAQAFGIRVFSPA